MKLDHILHKKIGEIIVQNNFKNFRIIKDSACKIPTDKEVHNLPLFCSRFRTNATEFCNVDILILRKKGKDYKVSVIIEVDESDIKPTQICGKFLTSALCSYYIYKEDEYKMDDSVLFIQIVDLHKLKEKTSKKIQFNNIEESIQNILPVKGSKINKYKLFKIDANSNIDKELLIHINQHLNS